MERLTYRIGACVKTNWKMTEILNRLAELEDKFENGTLVELPCKVGDTVCQFHNDNRGLTGIIAGKVTKIELNKNGMFIHSDIFQKFRVDSSTIGDLSKTYIDITCYYFCPQEEAEKR